MRFLSVFAWVGIAWGILLRLQLLFDRGQNYEIDQAVILYWGRQALQQGEFLLFGPEFTHWEMLMSYLAGGVDLLGANPQWVPVVFSFLEILLLGLVARKIGGPVLALLSAAALALSPFHIFYSSVIGSCVGVGVWVLLYLLLSSSKIFSAMFLLLGLFHYSAIRILLFAQVLWSFLAQRRREAVVPFVSFLVFVGAAFLFQRELWTSAFIRGSYIFEMPNYSPGASFLRGIFFWVSPALEHWSDALRINSVMEVSEAFRQVSSPWESPLGWLLSFGLLRAIVQVLAQYFRSPSSHFWIPLSSRVLFLFLVSTLVLAPVSSFTHNLWLLPLAILLSVQGLTTLGFRWSSALVVVALLSSGFQSHKMVLAASKPSPRDLMSSRISFYAQTLSAIDDLDSVSRFLVSPQALVESIYWSQKTQAFQAQIVTQPSQMESHLRQVGSLRGEQWILIDLFQDPDSLVSQLPGIEESYRNTKDFILHLRKYAQIIEERRVQTPISEALLIKIRWP